jgi:sugar phosphate isomerase/epimerase
MKFGFSSYSFHQRISTGDMSLFDVIDWVADSQGEHLELAVLSNSAQNTIPTIESDPDYVRAVKTRAADRGVTLSNMAIGAVLAHDDPGEIAAEVKRVKAYVDLAETLGITLMRHDVVAHGAVPGDDTPAFEKALPKIVDASKEIAQYAAEHGVTTSLENHGFFVQSSDRVRRIVHAVDEPNFKTTLDIGNFVCVDEDPTAAVPANLPYASIVHFKDFYIRPADQDPGEGWFRSRGGKYLRGAIVGNGDIDIRSVASSIKASGYDGFASIEFEGHEDCLIGASRGIANAIRLYDEA